MFKRQLTLVLGILLVNLSLGGAVFAQSIAKAELNFAPNAGNEVSSETETETEAKRRVKLEKKESKRLAKVAKKAEKRARKDAEFALKLKAKLIKFGTGKAATIRVKLRNGTKVEGYVSEINDDDFIVVDRTGASTKIQYPQTRQVKGKNKLTGAEIGWGLIGLAIVLLLVFGLASD